MVRDILRAYAFATEYSARRLLIPLHERRRERRHRARQRQRNIYPRLGCVFIHLPRAAGTSVHSYLTKLERLAAEPPDPRSPDPTLADLLERGRPRKHARAGEYRVAIGAEAWSRVYSFGLVRNPWALMVSCYNWWKRKGPEYVFSLRDALTIRRMKDFEEFVSSDYGRYRVNEYRGEMLDWFCEDGEQIVSFIGRVETLDASLAKVREDLGMTAVDLDLPVLNTITRGSYRDYYTPAARQLVADRFAPVIEQFGYEF